MVITFIILLIIILIGIIWKRGHLSLLEILTVGVFVSTINQNFIDIVTGNLKLIHITEQPQMFWSSLLMSTFLTPLIIILFLDYYGKSRNTQQVLGIFFIWIMILTGIDYTAQYVGVYHVHKWFIGWSFIEWLSILIAAICCRRFLYYLYAKGKSKKWSLHRQ